MKKIYLFAIINLLSINIEAQFQWAKREGLNRYDYGYGIINDNTGNVYVAGKYEDTAKFSGTTLSCAGNHDIYLAQYSATGTLNWIRTAGGTLGDYAHAVACDGTNNVFIAGEIEGYGNVISFVGSTITLQSVGDNDVFLSKYNLNGNLLWAKSDGWKYSDKAQAITYDNSGNVYIGGYYTDTTRFAGTIIPGYGKEDAFLAKYDMNGNFQWIRKAGSAGRDEIKSIKCDGSGNIYVCGMFSNGAIFSGQTLTCSPGYFDMFIAKYGSDGTLKWVKKGGGNYDDVAWSLTLDNQNKIYVAGEFNGDGLFGNTHLYTLGNADIFVNSYDTLGNLNWARRAGGTLIDRARGIGSDGTNIFITGQYGATANFGTYSTTAVDSSDIFIASLNNSGTFLWAMAVGGPADLLETLGYESGNAVCAEAVGNVYATGGLLNGGVFGTTTVSPYSRTDVFITKISSINIGVVQNQEIKTIYVYPNPGKGNFVLDISGLSAKKVEVTIYNCLGQQIITKTNQSSSEINIDLTRNEEGIYIAEIKTEDQIIYRKKLILAR